MKKIRMSVVAVTLFFGSSINIGMTGRQDVKVIDHENENEQKIKKTIIVAPKNTVQLDDFDGMDQVQKQIKYQRMGRQSLKNGEYEQALVYLKKALGYAINPDNANAWVTRSYLADTYEAMGNKAGFIREIDWLIKWCRNEETKQELLRRKQAFLA